jgi:cobalamin biosynthesis Mg chelatase CobN
MKITFAAILAVLAAQVAAQDDATLATLGFPKCAIPCIKQSNEQLGCQLQDLKCQCSNRRRRAIEGCMNGPSGPVCQQSDMDKIHQLDQQLCPEKAGKSGGSGQGGASASASGPTGGAASTSAPAGSSSAAAPTGGDLSSTRRREATTSAPAPAATTSAAKSSSAFAAPTQAPVALMGLLGAAAVLAL